MSPEENRQELLKEKRRQILSELMKKPEFLIELKEIKENIAVLSKKELTYNPDIRLVEAIDRLSQILKKIPEIEENLRPIIKVNAPEKVKIDWQNFPEEMKPKDDVKIDWEKGKSKLSPLFNFKAPIEWLHKQLESFLAPFLNKIIFLISEPDKVECSKNSMTEWYGNRKITYIIERNNDDTIKKYTRVENLK